MRALEQTRPEDEMDPQIEQQLRDRVKAERHLYGLTIRDCALRGEVSNTTWAEWEAGVRSLGRAMRVAVRKAFDWPADWPDNPPEAAVRDIVLLQQALEEHIRVQTERHNQIVALLRRILHIHTEGEPDDNRAGSSDDE